MHWLLARLRAHPAAAVSAALVLLTFVQTLVLVQHVEPVRRPPTVVIATVPAGPPSDADVAAARRTIGAYTQPQIAIVANAPTTVPVGQLPAGQGIVQVTGT